jgi:hypothetical protein
MLHDGPRATKLTRIWDLLLSNYQSRDLILMPGISCFTLMNCHRLLHHSNTCFSRVCIYIISFDLHSDFEGVVDKAETSSQIFATEKNGGGRRAAIFVIANSLLERGHGILSLGLLGAEVWLWGQVLHHFLFILKLVTSLAFEHAGALQILLPSSLRLEKP